MAGPAARRRPSLLSSGMVYTTPEWSAATQRAAFLDVVQRVVPEVVATLRERVWSAYAAIPPADGHAVWPMPEVQDVPDVGEVTVTPFNPVREWLRDRVLEGALEAPPDGLEMASVQRFLAELETWERSWNLGSEWVRRIVLDTLEVWARGNTETSLVVSWPTGDALSRMPDALLRWENERQQVAALVDIQPGLLDTEDELQRKASQWVAAVLQRQRTVMAQAGFTARVVGRARHLEWIANWQVNGESLAAVATRFNVARSTVEKAISEFRSDVTLPPRNKAVRPGRPSGRKQQ